MTAEAGPDLVVLSHGVHPYPRSAEAIVTAALIDALRSRGHDLAVLTSPTGYTPLNGSPPLPPERLWTVAPRTGLPSWRHLPRRDPRGLLARGVDRVGAATGRRPLAVSSWASPAAAALRARLPADGGRSVVWARALPEASLAAALQARRSQPFPLVCSLGDPLPPASAGEGPGATDRAVARLALRQVEALGGLADAWTFPCRRVLELVAGAAHLERARCFVVPHLVPRGPVTHPAPPHPDPPVPLVVYAGSAYRWLIDGPLLPALARAQAQGRLRAEVALRDGDAATVRRVADLLGGGTVHADLTPAVAADLLDRADAIVTPAPSPDLLYTKVVEAVGRAVPVLALTPAPGTTADVVAAAGGIVVDEQSDTALDAALGLLGEMAGPGRSRSQDQRAETAARLDPSTVTDTAEAVVAFARERFGAVRRGAAAPPAPALPSWP